MEQASSALRHAKHTVDIAFSRVREWIAKYPDVCFKQSRYGRELLAALYQAEKNLALLLPSKEMRPAILEMIKFLLESDPDDDLPPDTVGPSGSTFCI